MILKKINHVLASLILLASPAYSLAAIPNSTLLAATGFSLTATSKVNTVWATAYQMTVTLTNNTSTSTTSWTATFTLPNGYVLDTAHVSLGNFTVSGQNVTVTNLANNGVIAPGQSKNFVMMINMPLSASTIINNLQATANGSVTPIQVPVAPVLNAIPVTSNYTVSWNSVANATSYTLQQSTSSTFTNPTTIAMGNVTSKFFTNQAAGTYYYRVQASNAAGNSLYSNVRSITISASVPVPVAPVLNPIPTPAGQSYVVSWNSVANATSYTLQQSTTSNFINPHILSQGTATSKAVTGQPLGTYYYRVLASGGNGNSPYSNIESVTVSQADPISVLGIEHSVWYIDWTAWFTNPPYIIPTDVNVINIFVGTLAIGADGKPTVNGFGTFTNSQMESFIDYCNAQNPPIDVKISIGGGGGSYDHCWDLLSSSNIQAFAQGMADFCHARGLVGVDFDYEAFSSAEQETLVGQLIKALKQIDPTFRTSLCSNAGFGPNFPWQASVKNILDAAMIAPGNCAVDRLYVMSYYNPIEEEKTWVLGWTNWVIQNYGFTRARVSVGIDDFDAHAYDPNEFRAWAAQQGLSTAHWAFDPGHQ